MARIITLLLAMSVFVVANAETFSYRFSSTSLPEAIRQIMNDHPDLDVNFIYNELENYKTSATVHADDAHDALRQAVGLNPVTVAKVKNTYYVEALQHGKYVYTGRVAGPDNEPVAAATVMLLAPKDSTVLTYGIADTEGRFKIPCDRTDVIAKLSCMGYKTTYHRCTTFNIGTIIMPENSLKLNEIKVRGDNAHLYSDRATFIPTVRQKNAAQDAVDLLRQMALPLIRINPVSDVIKDNAGNSVALYINSLEATAEELEGMRTADVLRVEYLEFPTDPRFHGSPRVINFIMRQIEYGGYTKIGVDETFINGLTNRANIYTRFSYKKMTYDLCVGALNENKHHIGTSSESEYKLSSVNDETYSLIRREICGNSHFQQNQYPITISATYNAEKTQIRNQLGFTNLSTPQNGYDGQLEIESADYDLTEFYHSNPNRSNTVSYSGSYFFTLPRDFSLDFKPRLKYTHLNETTVYRSPLTQLNISAKENAVDFRCDLFVRKQLSQNQSLMLGANHGENINQVRYDGAEREVDKFNMTFSALLAGYQLSSGNFYMYVDAGCAFETNKINSLNKNDTYPFTHISFNYALKDKHQFSAYFQLASNTPLLSMKTSNIVQENEVYFISGNPKLKASRLTTVNLAYTWMPSNILGLSLYGFCESNYKRMLAVYEPFLDGAAIKRSYINNGDWMCAEIGLPVSFKPFDGKLQIYANPRLSMYKSTGIYRASLRHFLFSLQATYYFKNLYAQASWENRQKWMDSETPTIFTCRNYHSLTVGWSNSTWNLRVKANNLFNKGWKEGETYTTSPLFAEYMTTYGTTYHPSVDISVTYTIGYGRKVKNDNEVSGQSSAASAILK